MRLLRFAVGIATTVVAPGTLITGELYLLSLERLAGPPCKPVNLHTAWSASERIAAPFGRFRDGTACG